MIFALCGGDARTVAARSAAAADGGEVRAWALEDAALPPGVRACATAAECCSGAGCIVLPMPAEDGRGFLNAPFSPRPRCAAEALAAAEPGALVCAGAPSRALADICAARGLALARLRRAGELPRGELPGHGRGRARRAATRDGRRALREAGRR